MIVAIPCGRGVCKTDAREPVIGKGNYKFPWNLISVASCLHPHLAASYWGHSTAGSCHFFTSLVIFGFFTKLTILNVFVFQYALSPSDCNMNLKGTKSREANKNNSSCIAIKKSEFLRDSHELGEGKEPSSRVLPSHVCQWEMVWLVLVQGLQVWLENCHRRGKRLSSDT